MAHIEDSKTHKSNLAYIQSTMQEPLLSREDEYAFARGWTEDGNEAALHKLVKPYMRLVVSTAKKFKNYGLPFSDLVQEGNIGLMMAANRFETTREVRFSTYANWWIRSSIQDYVLRNWSIVRTGTTAAQKSLFFNFRRLRSRIEEETRETFGVEGRSKVAKELDVSLKDVETMEMRLSGPDSSLNIPVQADEDQARSVQDLLPDDRPAPDEVIIGIRDGNTRTRWLEEALGHLSDREQHIIRERRLNEESKTLETLGEQLGVSKERVRQLESRALEKLKKELSARVTTPQDLFLED